MLDVGRNIEPNGLRDAWWARRIFARGRARDLTSLIMSFTATPTTTSKFRSEAGQRVHCAYDNDEDIMILIAAC